MRISTLGKSASRRSPSGITLIELLVALEIVGAIFAVAATGLRQAFDAGLKNSSRRLGSLSRYLRTKAVTEHKYVRLVLDLSKSEYRVEESSTPFVIAPGGEEPPAKEEPQEEGEVTAPAEEFQEAEGLLVKPTRLESGAFFKDLTVSYLPEKLMEGEGMVYFFPDGYATPAVINLRDEDDEDHYSVEIFPMTGKVRIEGGYRELER